MSFFNTVVASCLRAYARVQLARVERRRARYKQTLCCAAKNCSPRKQRAIITAHERSLAQLENWITRNSPPNAPANPALFQCALWTRALRKDTLHQTVHDMRAAWQAACTTGAQTYRPLVLRRAKLRRLLAQTP